MILFFFQMMINSRHFLSRLATLNVRSRCFASTLVLAEQIDGGKLAQVTLNTYVSLFSSVVISVLFPD